ncbi:putative colanic acid biosysnthesis UDP-glucose lipid carrier transferase [Catalinimonas alkaloidigena]|uniref:Putative colanic acid biosysnthesis UDP-glucose lipid carrier transferase n=1 Tax=Catalinimonas alkaloidigena TaxID=1075417 RepID=A0A1G9BE15_9BACT|nr:undecaprenyl-phosphate glucose phosphotransferase [Catalinimonas alkaloidigena]SDK37772.1 putative colanic acid biosysnthesis UDP-glucose lipid carrier transferase [Catalinimonas alkaloidigena]
MEKVSTHTKLLKAVLLVVELLLLSLGFRVAYFLKFGPEISFTHYYSLFVIFNLAWIVSALFNDIYHVKEITNTRKMLSNLVYAFLLHGFIIAVYIVGFKAHYFSREFLVMAYGASALAVVAARFMLISAYKRYKLSTTANRKAVVIGTGRSAHSLHDMFITNKELGYRFMGFFTDKPEETPHQDLIRGRLEDIKAYCLREQVDEIYFALPITERDLLDDIAKFADDNFIYFRIVPDFSAFLQKNVNIYHMDSIPVMTVRKEPLMETTNQWLKRAFDIAFSLAVILFLFPFILPIIAIAIKLESEGPIFFKQMRPGKKNQLFACYKFRTMRINNVTHQQATKDDPRITKVGRFLRKTSLDELPQFFNVLLGDMSVVGPRPNMINQLEHYSKAIDTYTLRHFVTPGITGFAQVNGYRGETKQMHLMQKRVEYDVAYIENWSFGLDLKIILKTVLNIIKGEENAY